MATRIGKVFEKQLEQVMSELKDSHLLCHHRFADTGSAGGVIQQQQPSDYLVSLPPSPALISRMLFLEAKASEVHSKLQKSSLRASQRGAIHLYSGLLTLPYYVIFWSVGESKIEIWTGLEALKDGRKKSPVATWDCISTGETLHKEILKHHLIEFFKLPPKADTLKLYEQGERNRESA